MVASCSFFFCCFVFSFLFFLFVLLKFGSSVLRNQRHFGKAEDRKVVGCVMCSPCLFESKLHLFFFPLSRVFIEPAGRFYTCL